MSPFLDLSTPSPRLNQHGGTIIKREKITNSAWAPCDLSPETESSTFSSWEQILHSKLSVLVYCDIMNQQANPLPLLSTLFAFLEIPTSIWWPGLATDHKDLVVIFLVADMNIVLVA